MKSIYLTVFLLLINSTISYSQIVKALPEIKKYDVSFSNNIFITKDNEYVISNEICDFVYDKDGKLLRQVKQNKKNYPLYAILNNAYKKANGICLDSKTDVFYSIQVNTKENKAIVKTMTYNVATCVVENEILEVEDKVKPSRNLASPILNDFSANSEMTAIDSNGNVFKFNLYMSISKETHPQLVNFENNKFHTFLHIIKYSPQTKKIEILNGLIDKIDIERNDKNSAYGEVVGIIGSKVIVKYISYRSEELKGLMDATGSAKNQNISYWSYDLYSGEEKKLLEYVTNFPEKVAEKKIKDVILDGTLFSDLAWTDKSTDKKGYVSNHKILQLNVEGDTIWTNFFIPDSLLQLENSTPAILEIKLGQNNSMVLCNTLRVYLDKTHFKSGYFVFSKNSDDQIELKVYTKQPSIFEIEPCALFSYTNLTDEDIAAVYSKVRDNQTIRTVKKTAFPLDIKVLRVIDNELKVLGFQHAFELNKKQLREMPDVIQINSFPIEK